jgi:hypothetical protein
LLRLLAVDTGCRGGEDGVASLDGLRPFELVSLSLAPPISSAFTAATRVGRRCFFGGAASSASSGSMSAEASSMRTCSDVLRFRFDDGVGTGGFGKVGSAEEGAEAPLLTALDRVRGAVVVVVVVVRGCSSSPLALLPVFGAAVVFFAAERVFVGSDASSTLLVLSVDTVRFSAAAEDLLALVIARKRSVGDDLVSSGRCENVAHVSAAKIKRVVECLQVLSVKLQVLQKDGARMRNEVPSRQLRTRGALTTT